MPPARSRTGRRRKARFDPLHARALEAHIPDLNTLRDPVFVVSKGRADNCMSAMRLEEAGVDYTIMVEPQDEDAYAAEFGKHRLHVLDKNDGGIAYVRNAVLDLAGDAAGSWQLDDDVMRCWQHRPGNKRERISIVNMLAYVEQAAAPYDNIGYAGPMKSPYAFAYADLPPLRLNRAYASVAWNRNPSAIRYRQRIVEDYDAAMQWLSQGWCGLLAAHVSFESPEAGVQKGGLTETLYAIQSGGHDERAFQCQALIDAWPGAFRLEEKGGRLKLAPSTIWGKFPQTPHTM